MPLPAFSLCRQISAWGGQPNPLPPLTPSPDAQSVPTQNHLPNRASSVSVPACQKVPTSLAACLMGYSAHLSVTYLCPYLTPPVTPRSPTYKPPPHDPGSHFHFRITVLAP